MSKKLQLLLLSVFLCQNADAGIFDFFRQSPPSAPQINTYTLHTVETNGSTFSPRSQSDCGGATVDPAPFGPTRYQGDAGDCFAYATADVLTYCMKSAQISAGDIDLNFAESQWTTNNPQDFINLMNAGGLPWTALDLLHQNKGGSCPEADLTSDPGSYRAVMGLSPLDMNYEYYHGTDVLVKKIFDLQQEYDTTRAQTGQGALSCVSECGNGCFQKLGLSAPGVFGDAQFVNILSQATVNSLPQTIDSDLCDKHRTSFNQCLPMQVYSGGAITGSVMNGFQYFNVIDQQLAQGKPVEFLSTDAFLTSDATPTGGSNHAMILIGRKYRPATGNDPAGCYYQVRNSWGATCSGYAQRVKDCDPNTGYIWISEQDLSNNLLAVDYLAQ
jgi:hypothetical protein